MASSNTVFRPRCVNAEHSRYFTESVGRKAGAVMGREEMGVSRLGMQELAVNAADSKPCKRRRNTTDCCQDEREECICVSGTTLVQSPHSHNTLLPQCLFCRYVLMCIPKHHLNLLLR